MYYFSVCERLLYYFSVVCVVRKTTFTLKMSQKCPAHNLTMKATKTPYGDEEIACSQFPTALPV